MMIVNRRSFVVKPGFEEQAMELLKEEIEKNTSYKHPYRIYRPSIGAYTDDIVVEYQFENLEDYDRSWEEWFARPETQTLWEKWGQIFERGGSNEIWNLLAERT